MAKEEKIVQSYTGMDDIILSMRRNRSSIATIYKTLRETGKWSWFGDLVLLGTIMNCLFENKLKYTYKELYGASKLVKEGLVQTKKRFLLNYITKDDYEEICKHNKIDPTKQ